MSSVLTLGSFDKVDESNFSDEVKDIYKARYNPSDEYYKYGEVFKSLELDDRTINLRNFMKPYPKCYVWENMTEDERLEKGLPRKRDAFFKSVNGLLLFTGLVTYSFIQYDKIFSPKSPILRSMRKVSWLEYLK